MNVHRVQCSFLWLLSSVKLNHLKYILAALLPQIQQNKNSVSTSSNVSLRFNGFYSQ